MPTAYALGQAMMDGPDLEIDGLERAKRPLDVAQGGRRRAQPRVLDFDVLGCTSCGRLRLIATIEEPEVIRRILAHLGLPTALPATLPARSPPPTMPQPFD